VESSAESAGSAYDRFAAIYDAYNAQNDYETWLGEALLPQLERRGLRKGWALDVGCGTGRAFEPLLNRGWRVVGCDVSAGMLAETRRKFGSRVELLQLDARALPPISPASEVPAGEAFDLVLLLNDVVNYLTEDGDLERAFAGVRANLAPAHGLAIFDANTLALFRSDFGADVFEQVGGRGWAWRGLTQEVEPGGIVAAELSGGGVEGHLHRQRHWTTQQVREALEATGLRCLAALGQREQDGEIVLSDSSDEERDAKVIYIAGATTSAAP
jgi:SAM-dependent methyltransferase